MKTLISMVIMIGLIATAGSVIVGLKSFDGIVTEHPYETGILWDVIRKKKDDLGWRIDMKNRDFRTGENDIIISVLDKYDKPLAGSAITVMISRPATSAYDRYFHTIKLKEGLFRSMINFPLYGYWDVRIKVDQDKNNISFEQKIFAEKKGRKRKR